MSKITQLIVTLIKDLLYFCSWIVLIFCLTVSVFSCFVFLFDFLCNSWSAGWTHLSVNSQRTAFLRYQVGRWGRDLRLIKEVPGKGQEMLGAQSVRPLTHRKSPEPRATWMSPGWTLTLLNPRSAIHWASLSWWSQSRAGMQFVKTCFKCIQFLNRCTYLLSYVLGLSATQIARKFLFKWE